MIELTEEQGRQVADARMPIPVRDPLTKREFYLVSAERLAIVETVDRDVDPRDAYAAIERVFAPGWDSPEMTQYDDYEQHRP